MGRFTDLSGQKFGFWTVSALSGSNRSGSIYECICQCGCVKNIPRCNLISEKTKSCGCMKSSTISKKKTTHGHSCGKNNKASKVYNTWSSMINRCFNSENQSYKYYGKRGITVCDDWKIFENFLADMGQPEPHQSIDRINNNGNYEPKNCRWATNSQQMKNTSRTRLTDEIVKQIRSEQISAKEVCKMTGCSPSTYYAVKKGINWK